MVREMLEDLGYQITTSNRSPEALKIFQNQSEEISLIITDMIMPDLTGVELIQKVRIFKPEIPIILCSGFSDLINEVKARKMGVARYLMKPILQKDLAIAVRETLDNKQETSSHA